MNKEKETKPRKSVNKFCTINQFTDNAKVVTASKSIPVHESNTNVWCADGHCCNTVVLSVFSQVFCASHWNTTLLGDH